MRVSRKIIVAAVAGVALYGGIYLYARNSEPFHFVKMQLENSGALSSQVRGPVRITLPLFGSFKEKHINADELVTMNVNAEGSNGAIAIKVTAVRKNEVWEIKSVTHNGEPINIDQNK